MSDTQGERPVSLRAKVIGITATMVVLAGAGTWTGVAAHNAQVEADAAHAMTVAAPAYQGSIELGGSLDTLQVKSVQAKVAYDAEQARIAAEQAAQAAAAAAAAQAAAEQAAAQQAAQQQTAARQQAASSGDDPEPSNDVPFVPDSNSSDGGRFDTSGCGAAGATVNADGSVSCAG